MKKPGVSAGGVWVESLLPNLDEVHCPEGTVARLIDGVVVIGGPGLDERLYEAIMGGLTPEERERVLNWQGYAERQKWTEIRKSICWEGPLYEQSK